MNYAKPDKEVITPEGYALAPFFLRAVAMMMDAAVASVMIVGLYLGLFKPLSDKVGITSATDTLINYRLQGGLMEEDSDHMVHDIAGSDYEPYQKAVETFYLDYNLEGSTKCPDPLNFNITRYNEEILKLPKPGLIGDSYFVYQKDEHGENDYTKVGIIKDYYFVEQNREKGLTDEGRAAMLSFYQEAYDEAYTKMSDSSYYKAVMEPMQWKTKILLSAISLPPLIIVYLVMPLTLKNGATLGKKLMKLNLVTTDGYDLQWWRKAIRFVPLLAGAAIVLFVDDMFVALPVVGAFFLISMGFGLFTKRRQAIHDIIVLSVVAREEIKKE